jgi:hypothetical protein
MVHGIGDTPGENLVDVYIFEVGSDGSFELLIPGSDADFGYGSVVELGNLAPGDYDVLLCTASSDPSPEVESCADNEESAVNGNFGNTVTVTDAARTVLFAGFGEEGRPEVLVFVPDLSCVDDATFGRATANHAADAGPVTVSAGPVPVIENLANGSSASLDVPAAGYDVTISDGESLDIDTTLEVTSLVNTMAYVTGDPDMQDEYTVLTQPFPIEQCAVPSSSTTTTPPVAQTQPRFTG